MFINGTLVTIRVCSVCVYKFVCLSDLEKLSSIFPGAVMSNAIYVLP